MQREYFTIDMSLVSEPSEFQYPKSYISINGAFLHEYRIYLFVILDH